MLPVHYLIKNEVGQLAVHIFKVLHVSFFLGWCCSGVAGFAVRSVTSSWSETLWKITPVQHRSDYKTKQAASVESILRHFVTLTFWLFCDPFRPVWHAEGVRCRAAAGALLEDLGGFLGRTWDWLVVASFFLETAPLPVIIKTCTVFRSCYASLNILTWERISYQSNTQFNQRSTRSPEDPPESLPTPTWTKVPVGERRNSGVRETLCWRLKFGLGFEKKADELK